MSKEVLIAKAVGHRYGRGFNLESLDLTLQSGEITGVVGENGNGKTTLLRILAGDLKSDGGELQYFSGEKMEQDWVKVKDSIAYIPQRIPKWYGQLRDNLRFHYNIVNGSNEGGEEAIDKLLDWLGLTQYTEHKWSEISTGYRLRFQLAKVLLSQPKLLVLDEPIANLDLKAQSKFMDDLRRIVTSSEYHTSAILSSQQLHEVENVADRIIFLRQGKVVYQGAVGGVAATGGSGEETATAADQTRYYELQFLSGAEDAEASLGKYTLKKLGKTYYVETPGSVMPNQLLQELMATQAQIAYFRDNTNSTKRFFVD